MNDHVGKNYAKDGGDTWVVGGKLLFDNADENQGLHRIANLPQDATVADLIAALKESGFMVGDAVNINITTCTIPIHNTATNSVNATITYDNGTISVVVPSVAGLLDSDHVDRGGVHKWIGFGVSTGLESVVGLTIEDGGVVTTLTSEDADEAVRSGLTSPGQFIYYIQTEQIFAAGGKSLTFAYKGYEPTKVTIIVSESQKP